MMQKVRQGTILVLVLEFSHGVVRNKIL
ncbi:hypothetical protein MTR67_052494 [Solanum verrucosum]|uniref:Uncharacterized protein n=1 Tax=Solanum verrucosum TaxID=315347 RepID=A0AAF0V822_SOLVR|nr:hypothetical protein MTR67_052494 [Solanum verrucosum]